jgi:hypothetical protein
MAAKVAASVATGEAETRPCLGRPPPVGSSPSSATAPRAPGSGVSRSGLEKMQTAPHGGDTMVHGFPGYPSDAALPV